MGELDLDVHLPAIAGGDTDAFGRWMALAERPLRLGLRGLCAHVDVEAVLQETLLRVWQVAPRLAPDGRANATLRLGHRIARNLALDELRRARVEPREAAALERAVLEAAGGPDEGPRAPDPLLRRAIADCRARLPSKPARAITARIDSAGAEADHDLAAQLGMRTNTFLQNVTRARRLLAECLRRLGIDLEGERA